MLALPRKDDKRFASAPLSELITRFIKISGSVLSSSYNDRPLHRNQREQGGGGGGVGGVRVEKLAGSPRNKTPRAFISRS